MWTRFVEPAGGTEKEFLLFLEVWESAGLSPLLKEIRFEKQEVQMVTDRITAELEKGVIPWRRPWTDSMPVNWVTQKPYRGINTLLLAPGEYATFQQIKKAGGQVKRGEKGHIVVFWKWIEKEEKAGETKQIPLLRYYKVFDIARQAEGLKPKRKKEIFDHDPIASAEQLVKAYQNPPLITHQPGRAIYHPQLDQVSVPPMQDYRQEEEYYSVLFHELIHSTGHAKRLARKGITETSVSFGDETYSMEELVAEIGAAMLCGVAGIERCTIENSASYIQSWLRALKEDKTLVVKAAGQAQKAADYLQGLNVQE